MCPGVVQKHHTLILKSGFRQGPDGSSEGWTEMIFEGRVITLLPWLLVKVASFLSASEVCILKILSWRDPRFLFPKQIYLLFACVCFKIRSGCVV